MGRLLNDADDSSEGDHPVLVISDGFWKRTFGADPSLLNHKLKLATWSTTLWASRRRSSSAPRSAKLPMPGRRYPWPGVIPPGWGNYKANFSESLYILGRLKPGVTMEQPRPT